MRTLRPLLALALLITGCGGDGHGSGATSAPEGLRVSTEGWKTDFAHHSVPLGEISSGGRPRDGIPPIDEPRYVGVEQVNFLDDREPVLVVEHDGRARAYPLQILLRHEIVNDDFGARPLAVTYCPPCNCDYGANPYLDYEDPGSVDEQPFLLEEEANDRLPARERVVAVQHEAGATVVPFSRLEREPVVAARAGERPIVVAFKPGVVSALDAAAIGDSAEVGTEGVFDRRLDGRTLTFEPAGDGRLRDRQTGSTWDITGRAVDGELRGRRLDPVVHDQQFWFAVAAFLPDVEIAR